MKKFDAEPEIKNWHNGYRAACKDICERFGLDNTDEIELLVKERDRLKAELAEARETLVNHAQIQNSLLANLSLAQQEIAALKGDAEPVAWEYFSDRTYFDFCAVRPVGEKTWGNCFHVATQAEGKNLSHFLTKINAPNPWNAAMQGKDE